MRKPRTPITTQSAFTEVAASRVSMLKTRSVLREISPKKTDFNARLMGLKGGLIFEALKYRKDTVVLGALINLKRQTTGLLARVLDMLSQVLLNDAAL